MNRRIWIGGLGLFCFLRGCGSPKKAGWNQFQEDEMNRTIWIGALGLFCFLSWSGAQALPRNFSLYTDRKAKKVEDVITVMVVENAKATNDTKSSTDKTQD